MTENNKQFTRKFRNIRASFPKNPLNILVGDSETWRDANNPAFWIFKDLFSDKEYFFDKKSQVRKFIYHFKGIIYFHNLDFDLATFLAVDEVCVGKKISTGSKIIRFNWGRCELRDSLCILVNSVSKLGESLGYPKGKTPQKFIDGDSSKGINSDDIKYCQIDVDIVKKSLLNTYKFYREACGISDEIEFKYINLPLTAASTAYRIYSESFWPLEYPCIYIKKDAYDSSLLSYYGGRVQVFGEPAKIYNDIFVYDINSLYPSVMKGNEYPHPKKCFSVKPHINYVYHHMEKGDKIWGKFELDYEGDNPKELFLPCFTEDKKRAYNQPNFEGYLCQPELEYALNNNWKIKNIEELYAASAMKPFDEYVDYFWNIRKKFQENNDPLQSQTKIFLNSLYGKFGQKDRIKRIEQPEKIEEIMLNENWQNDYTIKYYDQNHWYLEGNETSLVSKNTWAGWSAFITSYARVKLQESIQFSDTIYCDTDSIHTTTKPEDINIKLGDELGEWKVEYKAEEAQYWEPKAYRFMENGLNITVKHKGANMSTGDLTKPQGARIFTKYKTALRQKIPYGEFRIVEKKSKRFYRVIT